MKSRVRWSVFGLILALVAVLASGGIVAAKADGTIVSVEPAEQTIWVGDQAIVEVWASNVTDFYGAQFELSFDETVVEGLSVEPGAVFTDNPEEYYVVEQSEIVSATVKFAATLLRVAKAPSFTGNAHLATITFMGLDGCPREPITSSLAFGEVKLSDIYAQPIEFVTADGSITVECPPCETVLNGNAFLEGRVDHSGITVVLQSSPVMTTTTDAAGAYVFEGVAAGTYTVTMSADMYLSAEVPDIVVYECETNVVCDVTLLGGDLNDDGIIDILDLALCAAHFGTSDPEAEVNADGIVDVYDLVLLGKNFKLEEPIVEICAF